MSYQMAPHAAGPPPPDRRLLFTPGPRLGWSFRDRRELTARYLEPRPSPQAIAAGAAARAADAERSLRRAWNWAGKPSIGLALILVLMAGCSKSVSGTFNLGLTAVAVVAACLPGLGYTGWRWLRREQARDVPPEQEYRRSLAEWDRRAAEHQAAELARLAGQPEWDSVSVPGRRTDVFGGTLAGWQALLVVHGASILAERPLLAVDLTGQDVAGALTLAAGSMRIQTTVWRLPGDLGRCGLIGELPPDQLADTIAEALHAGTPGGARVDRAVDVRVLRQLASALAGRGVTARRLAAAVRAALGHAVPGGLLSAEEQEFIGGDLFPPGYRQQVTANLVRLDAALSELAGYPGGGWPGEGWPGGSWPGEGRQARQQRSWLTCLSLDTGARSASGEVLTGLVAQWLTMQVSASAGQAPAVIVMGADEIARPHLERLSDACERRGVPLTLLFRHLRDDAAGMLGGGAAAFMRLGNHAEAEQAATYLGRRHTFVVSSFTTTRGGSQTGTLGGGDSYGTSDSSSDSRARNWQGGGFFGTSFGGGSSGGGSSGGRTRTTGTGTSRNQSTSWSRADGTSWSDAEARQRVYEFAVEPTVLQNLPEYALLLADRSGGALRLRAVECDPSIITLHGVSTGPLPPAGAPQAIGPPADVPGEAPGEAEVPWWEGRQPRL
jgi:hypothetical protein